jgi:hypothetical protein
MKKIFFLFSLLAIVCAISCNSSSSNNANSVQDTILTEAETLPYRDCTAASDCVYTTNGCCDCANGGEDIAVNKTKLADFKGLFSCEGISCTLLAPVMPCGSGTVSCKEGICEYTRNVAASLSVIQHRI